MNQYVKLLAVLFGSIIYAFSVAAQATDSNADQDGVSLYKNGEYQAAIPKLIREADSGAIDAQFHLGMAYFYGNGVPKSEPEGVAFYRMAAEAGHVRAANALGWAYGNARGGLAKNMEMAVKWYRIAAEGGNQYAQFNMGLVYDNGWTVPISHTEAFNWFQKAADQGNAAAATYVGLAYEQGHGVPKDEAAAVAWYLKGAQRGDKWGMTNYAYTRYIGRGSTKSYEEAFKWFSAAAQENYARAQYNLGLMYENGHGVPTDYVEARSWYKKAADQNYDGASDKFASLADKAAAQLAAAQTRAQNQPADYSAMDFGPLQDACLKQGKQTACIEIYSRLRGNDPEASVVAEHLCYNFNHSQYCYEAGLDLLTGRGNSLTDRQRAYDSFYKGCYFRSKWQSQSCYYGAMIRLADGGRNGSYDAMLMLETACYAGYRDSCALRKKAQRSGDAAVAAANKKLRANHDDALNCKKTRVVGHGGREYTSYDCRTNLEWRLGKRN